MAGAFLAWVFLAPGAQETLADYGITLPFTPAAEPVVGNVQVPGPGAGPRPGGPGAAGPAGRFGARAVNVTTTPVTLATVNAGLIAIGEGTAVRSVTVTSPSGGTLEELLVLPGDLVEAGDVIGRLDSETEQITYDRARLAAEDARVTLERQQELARSSLVATSALAAARLAADTAELELRSAQIELERRNIVAPISGIVGLMQVTPGNYLAAQTAVTTIDDTSAIDIDFWVPERYAARIEPGMSVIVSAIALPGRNFAGEVSATDNRIDPASRTLQVKASIPNEENLMRAGMSFTVELGFSGEEYPTVNPLAILWSAEGSYVWRYEGGTATRVMAEIVQRNSDGVLVRADLQPGDAIITEGILQLNDGMAVNLLDGPDGTSAVEAAEAATDAADS
ncbi:MexH family multidrug efflux RND transporter periplasmic adaptor subunit [Devosia nitrariae]|uniref:MexH family multidrug efflux RND transporter periplasmic adaptor subunit n=1 Tax=Devosia nitrariae TaxID=2071872 RepID=A0ABQ5W7V6_9HYPH|nr:MexH family multidrug efflux RND transporter periplasmic adaptor subunit [Devosia nitrariae]